MTVGWMMGKASGL